MNTNARISNRTFYKNTGHEKGNHHHGQAAWFYKNTEADRGITSPSVPEHHSAQDAAVASVMKAFKGTVVSLDAGTVHWHCREMFP